MNARHSKVTDWGLSHIAVEKQYTILDIGCGGGRTVSKLAALASEGKVHGIDYSSQSVAVARRVNHDWIEAGRVGIREASVSALPFSEDMFDLVAAVETHFWWPDLDSDMREVFRVLKPGGTLVVIAEIYRGAQTATARLAEKYLPLGGMKLLSVSQHRQLFVQTGFVNMQVIVQESKGWICAMGRKP